MAASAIVERAVRIQLSCSLFCKTHVIHLGDLVCLASAPRSAPAAALNKRM